MTRPHPLTPLAETAFSEAHKSANIICQHVCRTLQNGNLIALKLFDIVRRRTALTWPRHPSPPVPSYQDTRVTLSAKNKTTMALKFLAQFDDKAKSRDSLMCD